MPYLNTFTVEDNAFHNAALAVFCAISHVFSHPDPLMQLTSFVVGSSCFINTTLFFPMSSATILLSPTELPSITVFIVGDHSFENARLGPLCGSVADAPDANPFLLETSDVLEPGGKQPATGSTLEYLQTPASTAGMAVDGDTVQVSEEEAKKVLSSPLKYLKEVRIGQNCFFRTVVIFFYSTGARRPSVVDLPSLESITIGRGSFHDAVTLNLSCRRVGSASA